MEAKKNKMDKKKMNFKKILLQSMITCPKCGFKKEEVMPTNAFYTCTNCNEWLKPKEGDCCVFCSYGSVVCPPKQEEANCC